MSHPIDTYIAELETLDFMQTLGTGSPAARELLDVAVELFQRFEEGDQLVVLALMAGMVIGSCEGGVSTFERDYGTFLSSEDRIRVMMTVVRMAARESATAGKVFDTDNKRVS